MDLWSSNIETFLHPPWENSFYLRKWKPRKNFLCFLKRNLFLYVEKRKPQYGNSKKASYIPGDPKSQKTNTRSALKKILISHDLFAINKTQI